jgi:fructuronate reductase
LEEYPLAVTETNRAASALRLSQAGLAGVLAAVQALCVALGVAVWMRFLSGRNDACVPDSASDPPTDRLLRLVQTCTDHAGQLVDALFAVSDIFVPQVGAQAAFKSAVADNVRTIRAHGMRRGLAEFLGR